MSTMSNAQIIFNESVELMKAGVIGTTGRTVTITVEKEGQKVKETINEPEPIHTYKTWQRLGFQVEKGQKAIAMFTIWNFAENKKADDEEENEAPSLMKNGHYYMKKAAFFKASQVKKAGEDKPAAVPEKEPEPAAEPEQMTLDVFITITEPVEAPETPEAEEVPADDVKVPETTPDAPTAAYYDVNESTAERAWNCVHMSDYKKNSATNEYRASVDAAAQIAAEQKNRVSPYYHEKIDYLLDKYSKKLAAWYNDYNRNEASCPSWFISGPANYPVRKHERKMNRERSLWEEYDAIKGIIDKIKSVGTGPIDLSDPHAREMLEDRLQSLQAELNRDKELNAYYRKHKTFVGFPDLSPEKAEKMTADFEETKQRCPWITKIAPDYELTSLRDKIKRTQERISELDKREAAIEAGEDNSEDFTGGQIVRNIELDRLQIIFDEKPDEEMRDKLKGNGFKWSPKNNAWQRQLTPNAERALKYLALT